MHLFYTDQSKDDIGDREAESVFLGSFKAVHPSQPFPREGNLFKRLRGHPAPRQHWHAALA
jgi:hypothetical protein